MRISDVLAAKGGRVESVQHNLRADAIPARLDERGIGSVIVLDGAGRLIGMVTDRLLIKALARPGKPLAHLKADDIMQSPAPSCSPETTVAEAMRTMTDQRVRHLVVRNGERIAGVVSIGDLVKARLGDYELESKVLRERALGHIAAE